jgi:hypothetical protein
MSLLSFQAGKQGRLETQAFFLADELFYRRRAKPPSPAVARALAQKPENLLQTLAPLKSLSPNLRC